MIRILLIVLSFFIASVYADINAPAKDYASIYDSLEEADFEYIFGLDSKQPDEYKKYMYSPYPLFRSGVCIVFKSKTIPPGYYLLTPREKNGKTWVLFKENGRVSYIVPVYKEESVSKDFYKNNLPHAKLNPCQKTAKSTMGFIGKHFGKKSQRAPIPNAYIEFDDRGEFWDMILYYGEKKYYLLFKKF